MERTWSSDFTARGAEVTPTRSWETPFDAHSAPRRGWSPSVSLTTDFTSSAQAGDWVEAHATIRRAGRRLSFAASEFTVDGL